MAARSGFWVGIDGEDHDQVLQTGIAAKVTPPSTVAGITPPWIPEVEYWAWHEWYTEAQKDPSIRVSNLPISAGDTVAFVVWAPQRGRRRCPDVEVVAEQSGPASAPIPSAFQPDRGLRDRRVVCPHRRKSLVDVQIA